MMLNPTEMQEKHPVVRQLLADYMTQMTNQNLSFDDARAILEYFRELGK
jgi:maltooligosyltrehalose synthase